MPRGKNALRGYLNNRIAALCANCFFQKALDEKKQLLVGVNAFQESTGSKPKTLRINSKIERDQVQRLAKFKKSRDQKKAYSQLEKVRNAALSKENLVPLFVSAVESHVTLGEISETLCAVFGRHREKVTV